MTSTTQATTTTATTVSSSPCCCMFRMLQQLLQLLLVSILLMTTTTTTTTVAVVAHAKETAGGGNTVSRPIITMEELNTYINLATDYLVRVSHTAQQDPMFPGRFTYEQSLKEPLVLTNNYWNADNQQDDYNLLRHNGAIYSLGLSYHRTPRDDVLYAIQRGIGYLKTDALLPVPDVDHPGQNLPNMIAAWEKESFDDPKSPPDVAKLGGAGLALIALVHLERIRPGSTSIQTLRELGNFISYMQHPDDGSFTCKYSYQHGKNDDWTSLYYPGEAALGLTLLAELDTEQQEKWLIVATKTFLYLESLRRNQPLRDIEPDHWALLATAKLLPLLEHYDSDMEYWLVYNHGVRVATSLADAVTLPGLAKHGGCMTYDRRTCPTSTRLEGLLAALTFIRESEMYIGEDEHIAQPLRERIEEIIEYGVKFLLDAQELSSINNMQGGLPERYPIKDPEEESNVRVDYVQHSMSAIIAYEQYVLEKKRGVKLVRQGVKNIKKLRDKVADRIHRPRRSSRGDAVVAGPDAGINYVLLAICCILILTTVVMVYKPIQRHRRKLLTTKRRRDD
ncbi:hypothetical protein IV203_025815 [Nitzschia inconspicua]|uniref:Uncharacterized protein n=1 Tax=Nitzschia inconspicua TaxID=303405 RepID=A0A9K3P9U0_9STRA|nr:hypothetical protein IV203_017662 [Nitzschia inconspicua]KAG7362149.1 hypothetical protein IV203_025815 [Nitzschia inconspicua]